MTDNPVALTPSGPPETVSIPSRADADAALAAAGDDRDAVAAVVARWPRSPRRRGPGSASSARDDVEAYACYRVGYHRGLDRLRASGWRGSGYVRWAHETNRGFLRALHGLAVDGGAIGEADEQERCALFLRQLDPTWPPPDAPCG